MLFSICLVLEELLDTLHTWLFLATFRIQEDLLKSFWNCRHFKIILTFQQWRFIVKLVGYLWFTHSPRSTGVQVWITVISQVGITRSKVLLVLTRKVLEIPVERKKQEEGKYWLWRINKIKVYSWKVWQYQFILGKTMWCLKYLDAKKQWKYLHIYRYNNK